MSNNQPINDGGPAFPAQNLFADNRDHDAVTAQIRESSGMSLRDYFAAKAMEGWMATYNEDTLHPVANDCAQSVARMSYELADAMLAERAKGARP